MIKHELNVYYNFIICLTFFILFHKTNYKAPVWRSNELRSISRDLVLSWQRFKIALLLIRERLCLAYFGVSIHRTDSTAGYLLVKYCAVPVVHACECDFDSYFIIVCCTGKAFYA